MSRPTYPSGPAHLTHNAYAVQFADDTWSLSNDAAFFDINTNLQGLVDTREQSVLAKVSGMPLGVWGASAIAKLFPYQPGMRGQNIFPGTDLPLVIQTAAGKSLTFAAAALSKMPPITFTSNKALFGSAEWTCLRAGGAIGTTAGDFVTIATSAYTEPTLTPSAILTGRYALNFGALTGIETEDGVTFTPSVQVSEVRTANGGVVNYRIDSVTAEISFTPVNLTEADLYASLMPMDGTGTGLGSSRSAVGGTLTVTGATAGMPILTVALAFADKSSLRFGKDGRLGAVTLRALRASSSGTLSALYALTTAS